ncbi:hypothetical protein FB451DRAFT_1195983 [Mycena latifolia]|nr:hypothetical protein FB451DRAFT_1195983 [Mycena latifolia]
MSISQQYAPMTAAENDQWAPSMPNSDHYTLISAKEVADLVTPKNQRAGLIVPRRVIALRTSPLGRFPPITAPPPPPAAAPPQVPPSAAVLADVAQVSTPESDAPASPEVLQPSCSRAIGLGHPSTSKWRNMPLQQQDSPASPQASPLPRTRINSSTIKRRTKRFPGRELHAITEDPVTPQPSATASPVPGTRKRSYAAAASTPIAKTCKKGTGRRFTPTPGSPRCASDSKPRGPSVSYHIALAPRYTSSGSPQAGPTQVQSPRVLFPVTMAGSPRFQSLDGTIQAINVAREAEEERIEDDEGELVYGEDEFIKFKVHAKLRIRFAARRMKMLF